MSRENKEETLLKLYNLYYNELFNYGYRIAQNEDITRDCIQDLFLQMFKRATFNDIRDPKPYLIKSLRFIIIDVLKKNKKLLLTPNEPNWLLSAEDIQINNEIDEATGNRIKIALDTLTHRQKEIIYLRFFSGFNYEEIAQITGINNQSVRNLFSTAIKQLRKIMLPILLMAIDIQAQL